MQNRYYSLTAEQREAEIRIFGDITSWPWLESDVSSYTLSKAIEKLDADVIRVYINSYGGEVGEGWAIYNMLRQHKAKVVTYAAGFACSIASVIFMAGSERVMMGASMLMVHNVWGVVAGNADDLRKEADTMDAMSQISAEVYKSRVNISDEELTALLDAETWLTPSQALEKGFATSVMKEPAVTRPSQSAKTALFSMLEKADAAKELQALRAEISGLFKQKQEPQKKTFFNF